jgi:hypothetical protein
MANGTTGNTKNPVSDLCVAEDPAQELKLLKRQVTTTTSNNQTLHSLW